MVMCVLVRMCMCVCVSLSVCIMVKKVFFFFLEEKIKQLNQTVDRRSVSYLINFLNV